MSMAPTHLPNLPLLPQWLTDVEIFLIDRHPLAQLVGVKVRLDVGHLGPWLSNFLLVTDAQDKEARVEPFLGRLLA
jgi:hypothetical protein